MTFFLMCLLLLIYVYYTNQRLLLIHTYIHIYTLLVYDFNLFFLLFSSLLLLLLLLLLFFFKSVRIFCVFFVLDTSYVSITLSVTKNKRITYKGTHMVTFRVGGNWPKSIIWYYTPYFEIYTFLIFRNWIITAILNFQFKL